MALETIQQLLDEIPVLSEISKDLPLHYQTAILAKIVDLCGCLEAIHTHEVNKETTKNPTNGRTRIFDNSQSGF